MTDTNPVLTTAASLSCTFKGAVVTSNPGTVKLIVAGNAVLLAAGVSQWTVTTGTCTAQAGNSPAPCATVGTPTAGASTKLKSNGQAVLLSTFGAPSVGSAVTAGHTVSATAATPSPVRAV
jgi:hypothetical protein